MPLWYSAQLMKKTALLLVVGVFIGYFLASERAKAPEFVFDTKHYSDNDSVVSISGTLAGKNVGKAGPVTTKNNTVSITCYHDRMVCWTSSIDGIGGGAEELA